jgi:hypothetical protein
LHPDFLLKQLTSRQLAEWEAYNVIDPIGEWRADFRISYLASLITNLAIRIHGKKGAKSVDIEEFLLKWDAEAGKVKQEDKVQSVEEIKRALMSIASIQNKKAAIKNTPPPKSLKK